MAKFACLCGYIISTSGTIPNQNEWCCISDMQLEELGDETTTSIVYESSALMYRCPKSDHLWVFWDGFDHVPKVYTPSDVIISESWLHGG